MGTAVGDVLSEGGLEETCILECEGDLTHQLRLGNILHIDSSDEDPSSDWIPKAGYEAGYRSLPRARGPHEGIDLSLGYMERDILQDI